MKAIAIEGVRKFKTVDIPEPAKDGNKVIIAVKKCGICGSDLHYFQSGAPVDLVMGHEFSGEVVDPGNRTDLNVGDRVTALPISPCGTCEAYLKGNPQYCPETWNEALGLSLTNPGAYAENSSYRPDLVIKVPGSISDQEVAMIEPTAVGLHAVHLANIKLGDKVLIIGAGIIGQICGMFAKMAGATYVAMSETNDKRGRKAVKLGSVDETFNPTDKDFMIKSRKKCPYGYDVVIDCCGNSPAVSTAYTQARPNGTVVLVGVAMQPIAIPTVINVLHELKVYGAIAYTRDEFQECIDLMATKKIDMKKYIDDIVGLSKVQESFERLTSGNDDAIKILIDPSKK